MDAITEFEKELTGLLVSDFFLDLWRPPSSPEPKQPRKHPIRNPPTLHVWRGSAKADLPQKEAVKGGEHGRESCAIKFDRWKR